MPAATKKRIKIKPFSKPPKLPSDFYDKTSRELLEATSSILLGQTKTTSLQTSYNGVVNLVSHQFGPRLYTDLLVELEKSTRHVLPGDKQASLEFLGSQYPNYVNYLLLVRHVFMALDRPYVYEDSIVVKRTSQSTTLLEVGLHKFAQRLAQLQWDELLYEKWWILLWEAYTSQSTNPLLQTTMTIWKDLGMARQTITQTQPRLTNSLTQVSNEWKSQTPYSGEKFLQYVYNQWTYVSHSWGFLPKTWLRTLLETHLLEPHLNSQFLLNELDITNIPHCQRLWQLANRLEDGLSRVLGAVCSLVRKQGLQCVKQQNPTPKLVIGGLLTLHSQLAALARVVGELPLKQTWTEVVNVTPLVAEWLAKYVDLEFKNFKQETRLEPLLFLFQHLAAKDVFEAFYKKDLAKRLLNNKIHSMDIERQFVSLLKTECGAGYTSKMEGMFQDIEWSRESLARYKASPEFASNQVDMEVQILTTGYWPVYAQYKNLVLPQELTDPQSNFLGYYKTKYQGRKIVWQYALGNCMLKYTGSPKTYEFIVSLCQGLVLLCFNEKMKWTFAELSQRIGLEDKDELERVLISMTQGKEHTRILRKNGPKGKKIAEPDTIFFVNEKFTSPMRRVKVGNMWKKETKEERDKVVEAVSRDRLYLIDAVLVRIMKARKTILHQQLLMQVLEQVKVPAQPGDIKKRIESLIEREYMERDESDRNRYNYLA